MRELIIGMLLLGCVDNNESSKRVDSIKASMQECGDFAAECTEDLKGCTESFGNTVDLLQDSVDDLEKCHAILERIVGKAKKGSGQ